jgi:hypothetical protein
MHDCEDEGMDTVNKNWDIDINKAYEQMIFFMKKGKDGYAYIMDPNDEERVLGHYGETHLCAALLMFFRRTSDPYLKESALQLLEGILYHWDSDAKSSQSHADFNNFALALIYEELKAIGEDEWANKAIQKMMTSKDSRTHTVNWLPMRAYANLVRFDYSNEKKYFNIALDSLNAVNSAQYNDGMFEDLLPKGKSFNLQYCISTAATAQLIFTRFANFAKAVPEIDIKKTMSTLYALVLPDGDINYMGRGCNQIFAWGPWKYLMENYSYSYIKENSLEFLAEHFSTARDNCNLFLNNYDGKEQILWWDYHHYTVYMAHFLMWNELSLSLNSINTQKLSKTTSPNDSGLNIYKSDDYFAVTFNGREHYLIEKGPALVALWTKKQGMVFKCGHGPSTNMFSLLHFSPLAAYMNHFGLLEITEKPKRFHNRYIRRIYSKFTKQKNTVEIQPIFNGMKIEEDNGKLKIVLSKINKENVSYLVIPSFSKIDVDVVEIKAESVRCGLWYVGTTPSQYGNIYLYMTNESNAEVWTINIDCR